MYCPKCGKEIADHSVKYCSRCGASLKEEQTGKKIKKYPIILIAVFCLAALGIVIWQFAVVREKPRSDLSAAGPSLTATPAPESSPVPAVTDQPQDGEDSDSDPSETVQPQDGEDSDSDPSETVQPQSSSDSAEPLSAEEIEEEIQEIRDIYYGIQYHPDQLAAEDAGAGVTRYRDAEGNIVKFRLPKARIQNLC